MKRLLLVIPLAAQIALSQAPSISDGIGNTLNLLRDGQMLVGYNHHYADLSQTFKEDHAAGLDNIGEKPDHFAHITKPFYLATREVTVGQFRQFVDATGYVTTAEKSGDGIVGWHNVLDYEDKRRKRRLRRLPKFTWKSPGFEQGDDHPVVGVSWTDAQAFCAWLSQKEGASYRLPTEVEWEYACGAGNPGFFSFGNDYHAHINRVANYADWALEQAFEDTAGRQTYLEAPGDGVVFTSSVGRFEANPWGFHDMHGNVWELCQDYYHDTYFNRYKPQKNTHPPRWTADPANLDTPWNSDHGEWRIIKGGSWVVAPANCRRSFRSYFEAADGACYLGFRVARDASGPLMAEARSRYARTAAAMTALEAHPKANWEVAFHDDKSSRLVLNPPSADMAQHLPYLTRVSILEIHGVCPAELLPAIAQMPDLRALRMYRPGRDIPSEAYDVLAKLANLEELAINNYSNIDPACVANWACISNLRILSLGNDQLAGSSLAAFRGKDFSKLEELRVESIKTDGSELSYFAGAPLKKLGLNSLSDAGAQLVGQFRELTELRVGQPAITGAGLAQLSALTKLKSLRLSNLKSLSDADFAPLAQMTALEEISLSGSGAGDRTAANLAKLPNLHRISIGSPAFTDEGMRHIGSIAALDQLLEFGQEAAITDAGLEHIWAPDRVTMLFLRPKSGITGSGLNSIAENLTRLAHVEINSVDFNDDGMRLLGYMPALRVLRLHGESSKISDAGLLALAEAPKLKELDLRHGDHPITDAGIAAMKKKLPNLKVIQ
jgi:formylglycine-generating enzyme required for sulfatase activity